MSNSTEAVRFKFSRPQYEFLKAQEKYVAAVAGFGSGKTFVGLCRLYQNMVQAEGKIDQAYLAPSYPLIRDIFYPAVEEVLDGIGHRYTINQSKHIVEIQGLGNIYCRTMEKPDRIVGWEVADAVLDEFDILPVDKALWVFRKVSARLRQKNPTGRRNQLFITTTPEGFRATYQLFKHVSGEHYLQGGRLIQMSTYSNQRNLPDDYIEELLNQYPAQLIEAYLNGEFVNLTSGRVYKSYDRAKNRSRENIKDKEQLYIGQDFNVGKMASTIFVKRDNGWHAVEELVDLMDTPALVSVLASRFPGHPIWMYPDASGKNRKSQNASDSDIALLRQAGYRIRANSRNPYVKDRVLSVNAAFDHGQLWINDEKCPNVVAGLEQQAYDKNGEPDKSAGVDHQNDATGYFCVYEMPIKKPIILDMGIGSAGG